MVAQLQELQTCLSKDYKPDVILRHKLLNSCKDIDECLARQKIAPTVERDIADLNISIATAPESKLTVKSTAFITDFISSAHAN